MATTVEDLYKALLSAWNERNAQAFARLFVPDGNAVGFDGSQMNGRDAIEKELSAVFAGHETARYVSKIREVRELSPTIQLLRSVAGMVPPGERSIKPDVNAIQTMVASQTEEGWQIELFQNTPAQFHGRPEMVQALTDELNELV
jgi:uncharacterized protein (TIGR02246 family)